MYTADRDHPYREPQKKLGVTKKREGKASREEQVFQLQPRTVVNSDQATDPYIHVLLQPLNTCIPRGGPQNLKYEIQTQLRSGYPNYKVYPKTHRDSAQLQQSQIEQRRTAGVLFCGGEFTMPIVPLPSTAMQ